MGVRVPRLTVGIPTFNRATWLRESISSVLAQSFTDLRLVISDNASDDETPDVVRGFADPRIQYVRSPHNIGAIGNLNRLISLAESEFLVLLPDDDLLYPGHLEAAVEILGRLPSAGVVHSAFHEIDAGGRFIRCVQPVNSRTRTAIQPRDRALEWLIGSRYGLCFPSSVYRTAAIRDAGGFRAADEPFGDRKLWMRLALTWDFAYVSEPLVAFRAHDHGITSKLAADRGRVADARERALLYAQIRFDRSTEFLDEAPIEPELKLRLLTTAKLQRLTQGSHAGLPASEVVRGLAGLARSHPRVLSHPGFWRLLLARSGGATARALVRGAIAPQRARDSQGAEETVGDAALPGRLSV